MRVTDALPPPPRVAWLPGARDAALALAAALGADDPAPWRGADDPAPQGGAGDPGSGVAVLLWRDLSRALDGAEDPEAATAAWRADMEGALEASPQGAARPIAPRLIAVEIGALASAQGRAALRGLLGVDPPAAEIAAPSPAAAAQAALIYAFRPDLRRLAARMEDGAPAPSPVRAATEAWLLAGFDRLATAGGDGPDAAQAVEMLLADRRVLLDEIAAIGGRTIDGGAIGDFEDGREGGGEGGGAPPAWVATVEGQLARALADMRRETEARVAAEAERDGLRAELARGIATAAEARELTRALSATRSETAATLERLAARTRELEDARREIEDARRALEDGEAARAALQADRDRLDAARRASLGARLRRLLRMRS